MSPYIPLATKSRAPARRTLLNRLPTGTSYDNKSDTRRKTAQASAFSASLCRHPKPTSILSVKSQIQRRGCMNCANTSCTMSSASGGNTQDPINETEQHRFVLLVSLIQRSGIKEPFPTQSAERVLYGLAPVGGRTY